MLANYGDKIGAALTRALNASLSESSTAERPSFVAQHLIAQLDGVPPPVPSPGAVRCSLPPDELIAFQRLVEDALNAAKETASDYESFARAVAEYLRNNADDGGTMPPPEAPQPLPALTQEEFERATERYSSPTVLRTLLVHNDELGGVAVRLLSARWLLTFFSAKGNEGKRLEHRQQLEREYGDAPFIHGEALERVLAELEVEKDEYGREFYGYKTRRRVACTVS